MKRVIVFSIMLGLTLTCYASQSNLVSNGDCEIVSSGWASCLGQGTANFSWDTSYYVSGTRSLKIDMNSVTGVADWRQTVQNIDPNIQYRLRGHIRVSNIAADSHAIELQWFNGGGYIDSTTISATTTSTWQEKMNEDITPPAGTTYVYVLLRAYKQGIYYFDDITLLRKDNDLTLVDGEFPIVLYSLPDNHMVLNGNFEKEGTSGLPEFWTTCVASGTVIQTRDTTNYVSSNYSVKTVMTSATGVVDWRQLIVNIDPNMRYNFMGHIYASNVTADSHAIDLQWFDANNSYISSTTYSATTAGTWQTFTGTNIEPPAGAVKVYVLLRTYKQGAYYFDDISLDICLADVTRYAEIKNVYAVSGKWDNVQ